MTRYLPYLIWSLLIGLMASDVITTTYLMQLGGQEGNTFLVGIVGNPLLHIAAKLLVLGFIVFACFWLEKQAKERWNWEPGLGLVPAAYGCCLFAWAVGNNLSWIIAG